jgi:hypothetical protein
MPPHGKILKKGPAISIGDIGVRAEKITWRWCKLPAIIMGLLIDEEKVSRRNTSPIQTRGNTKSIFILKTIIHQTRSDTPKSRHLVQLPYTSFSFATKTNLGGGRILCCFSRAISLHCFSVNNQLLLNIMRSVVQLSIWISVQGGGHLQKWILPGGCGISDYNIYADVTSVSNFHNKMVARSAA